VNPRLTAALERKISAHNRLVDLSTVGGALAVLLMWTVVYALGCWLPILVLTAIRGVDAEAPAHLRQWMMGLMIAWMILGWFDRQQRLQLGEQATEPSISEVAWSFLMTPPRATFGVWDNPRNRVHLSGQELVLASDFLERLYRGGKMPVYAVALELPDDSSRVRILAALRLTGLVRWVATQTEDFLVLANPERVRRFVEEDPLV
jgi:hypothetical protein